MVTGFEMDGQRIAQAQVRATLELVKAIRELIEVIKARPRPKLHNIATQDLRVNSFHCRSCGTLYTEESGAYNGFTCDNCS